VKSSKFREEGQKRVKRGEIGFEQSGVGWHDGGGAAVGVHIAAADVFPSG